MKTWYGMPAYALDGKVLCFFKPADKFKMRYCDAGLQRHRERWTTGTCGRPSSP